MLCESGPVCVMCGELSASSKEADRFSGHFGVFFVGAAHVGGDAGRSIGRFNEIVAEEIVFNFFAGHVSKHHAINLDTGRKGLAGLLHHLGIVGPVVDDIDVLEGEAMLAHDGADTVGPPAGGLEIGFDLHSVNVGVGKGAAR